MNVPKPSSGLWRGKAAAPAKAKILAEHATGQSRNVQREVTQSDLLHLRLLKGALPVFKSHFPTILTPISEPRHQGGTNPSKLVPPLHNVSLPESVAGRKVDLQLYSSQLSQLISCQEAVEEGSPIRVLCSSHQSGQRSP